MSARSYGSIEQAPSDGHGYGKSPNKGKSSPGGVSRELNTFQLSVLIFFCVSGGPYGCEQAVSAAPPVIVIGLFLLLPWLWSLPIGLVTSEMAAAFPDDGGGMIEWVGAAFGGGWARVAALWYWASCTTDNALYAILFPHYLEHTLMIELGWQGRLCISLIMLTAIAIINIKGIDVVGDASLLFGVLALTPIIMLCLLSIPSIEPRVWLERERPPMQWNLLLAIAIWGNSGFDDVGCLVVHVREPKKTYPRAMLLTVMFVTVVNTLPIMFAICVDRDWANWNEGHFEWIANAVGGIPLRYGVSLGSLIALFSELNVLLLVTAQALNYMSVQRWLPSPLSWTRSDGTPYAAIIATSVITAAFLAMDFAFAAEIHTALYAVVIAMELISCVWLRWRQPSLPRPYAIPGGVWLVILISLIPLSICGINLALASLLTQQVMLGFLAVSLIIVAYYHVSRYLCPSETPETVLVSTLVLAQDESLPLMAERKMSIQSLGSPTQVAVVPPLHTPIHHMTYKIEKREDSLKHLHTPTHHHVRQ